MELKEFAYIDLYGAELDKRAVSLVTERLARQSSLIPVSFADGDPESLVVAMADPCDFVAAEDVLLLSGRKVIPVRADKAAIAAQIDHYFGVQSVMNAAEQYKKERADRSVSSEEENAGHETEDRFQIVTIVRCIMEQAVRDRASDIHFEPMKNGIRIRFRIDGSLKEIMTYDQTIHSAIISRVKIISGMDISEKRKPQDGSMSLHVDGREYDVRVSSLPTVRGEKIAMRLNAKDYLVWSKDQLGMNVEEMKRFDRMLEKQHGLILVTGPTGSGKTTTLYTVLNELNREEVNIVTVEDPAEGSIEGVNQVQINPKADLTFATALRSILRQDPDIIMIGEVRDEETARIAIRASITGHLVAATLHTNSTSASIARLADMGMEPYLIADALTGVIAQRLVRRLCSCRKCREASEAEKLELGIPADEDFTVYDPAGCPRCSNTGYYGRTAVFEMMQITPEIRSAIVKKQPSAGIRGIALKEGMRTLRAGAIDLAKRGITSVDEIRKLLYEDE